MSGEVSSLKAAIEKVLHDSVDGSAVVGICRACAEALPCDGAAVTVMAADSTRETVFASGPVIAAFEDAQYTLGEGPSLDVFTSGHPVLVQDFKDRSARLRWPVLTGEVTGLPLGATFCFPLRFGALSVGVCSFYQTVPGPLDETQVAFVLTALDVTTLALLAARAGTPGTSLLEEWMELRDHGRNVVHQATGMVMSQLNVPAESAFARLRGEAYARGFSVEQVATDIISRRIRLQSDQE